MDSMVESKEHLLGHSRDLGKKYYTSAHKLNFFYFILDCVVRRILSLLGALGELKILAVLRKSIASQLSNMHGLESTLSTKKGVSYFLMASAVGLKIC